MLKNIWDYYGPKLPQIREHLDSLVDLYDIDPPWDSEGDAVAAAAGINATGSESEGGIWTPGEPAAATSGEGGKLWVPGQE